MEVIDKIIEAYQEAYMPINTPPTTELRKILTKELAFIKEVEGVLEKGDASMYQHKDAVAKALKLIRNVDTCEQIPTKGE